MIDFVKVPQTASMNDIKNKTITVLEKFKDGPVLLMNRATPQAVLISPDHWNEIVEQVEDMQDAIITLQAELEITTGTSQVETIDDPTALISEIMDQPNAVSA